MSELQKGNTALKVVKASEMSRIEKAALKAGSSDMAFMEAAGLGISLCCQNFLKKNASVEIILLCGKGNNAGDAYVAGLQLMKMGYQVVAWEFFPPKESSPLKKHQQERFSAHGGRFKTIYQKADIEIQRPSLFLDGLFGTGFQGRLEGFLTEAIEIINHCGQPIFSIDIPSGLNGNTGAVETTAIKAAKTLFLELPKTGFFIGNGWNYIGELESVDFGLPRQFIDEAHQDFLLLVPSQVASYLPSIQPNRHKYEAGYVVGLTGSSGMSGAAMLSGASSLRAGAGIVRLWHPEGTQAEMSTIFPELLHNYYAHNFEELIASFNKASANYFGPGIGRSQETFNILSRLLQSVSSPCVLDADALFFLSETSHIRLPNNSILTPHKGEMDRLLDITDKGIPLDDDYFRRCQEFTDLNQITLVLKGAPSLIFSPNTTPFISTRGSPGMATAGSGDVLTGIIAALLGQKLAPLHAALLGVYLHGMAGELAAKEKTAYSLIASDLINTLPLAFKELQKHVDTKK